MFRVFNMGLGMVAVCEEQAIATVQDAVPDVQVVGKIVPRQGEVQVLISG
jgi:phosphoribosylaminoimidazole (AIR) synthetase